MRLRYGYALFVLITVMAMQPGRALYQDADTIADTLFAQYLFEGEPYVNFISNALLKDITFGDKHYRALSETEYYMNDWWYWTDDNAKSLEAMILPGTYERHKAAADDILRFVYDMMDTDLIFRRIAGYPDDANENSKFVVESKDKNSFRFHNGLMDFIGDVNHGWFGQSYRFHDGREQLAVIYSGNMVIATFDNGEGRTYDVEDAITHSSFVISDDGERIILTHTSSLPIGEVTYEYTVSAVSTPVKVNVRFTPSVNNLRQVVLTSAVDQLASAAINVDYRRLCAVNSYKNTNCEQNVPEVQRGLWRKDQFTPSWYAISQLGGAGFAYGLFTLIEDQQHYQEVFAERIYNGRVHSILTRYRFDQLSVGQTVSFNETKLMTSGGLYDDIALYDDLITSLPNAKGLQDYSVSYDYGAELNALATYYFYAVTGKYHVDSLPIDLPALRALIDRHLQRYFTVFTARDNNGVYYNMFLRGGAYLVMAINTMAHAHNNATYHDYLLRALRIVLSTQRTNGEWPCMGDAGVFVDCQAAVLLALSRVASTFDFDNHHLFEITPAVLEKAIVNGINAYHGGGWKEGPNATVYQEMLQVGEDGILWSFKCGITLRAFHALDFAVAQGRITMTDAQRRRSRDIADTCAAYLLGATRDRVTANGRPMKEVKTSYFSAESNTETQPWTTLGLLGGIVEPAIGHSLISRNGVVRTGE